MDFSIIEGLTDEELNELYNDSVIQDPDTAYAGFCVCWPRPGGLGGSVSFGIHKPMYYNCYGTHSHCGYCGMKDLVGTTRESCITWCTRHEFAHAGYNDDCHCTKGGGHYGVTWSTCR